jgi:predicted RecA/RadA family phage recombinase
MAKNLVQGEEIVTVPYSNVGSAITSGSVVVLTHCVGVALGDIAATTGVGTVAVGGNGVWRLPKVTASAVLIGEKLIWDVSAGKFDNSAATPASGDITGCAVAVAAANGTTDTTVDVLLTPGNATLT